MMFNFTHRKKLKPFKIYQMLQRVFLSVCLGAATGVISLIVEFTVKSPKPKHSEQENRKKIKNIKMFQRMLQKGLVYGTYSTQIVLPLIPIVEYRIDSNQRTEAKKITILEINRLNSGQQNKLLKFCEAHKIDIEFIANQISPILGNCYIDGQYVVKVPKELLQLSGGGGYAKDLAEILALIIVVYSMGGEIADAFSTMHIPGPIRNRLPSEIQKLLPPDRSDFRDSNAPYNPNNSKGNNPYGHGGPESLTVLNAEPNNVQTATGGKKDSSSGHVKESFKSNNSLKKVTKRALENQDVNREYIRTLTRIREGVNPMDIGKGSTDLGDNLIYVRGRHGRYIVKNDNGIMDIVGIAYRGSKNDMKILAKEMNKSYNANIEPGGY